MSQNHISPLEISSLEEQLATATKVSERIRVLENLIGSYVYTQPARARRLLDQLQEAYREDPHQGVGYGYYLHLGNLDNQEYADVRP